MGLLYLFVIQTFYIYMTKDVKSSCFATPEGVREQKNLGCTDLELVVTFLLT